MPGGFRRPNFFKSVRWNGKSPDSNETTESSDASSSSEGIPPKKPEDHSERVDESDESYDNSYNQSSNPQFNPRFNSRSNEQSSEQSSERTPTPPFQHRRTNSDQSSGNTGGQSRGGASSNAQREFLRNFGNLRNNDYETSLPSAMRRNNSNPYFNNQQSSQQNSQQSSQQNSQQSSQQNSRQQPRTSGVLTAPKRMVVEDDSDSDSSSESDTDIRQATRANTIFNRFRYSPDSNTTLDSPQDPPPSSTSSNTPNRPSSAPRVPSITISEHPEVNAYSHLMDIGSKTSGGLAPGGSEHSKDDPLNDEYKERRNRLLSSVGIRSQPSSPKLGPAEDDPRAIPLPTLHDSRDSHINSSHSMSNDDDEDTAAQAEYLRKKLELSQIQRQRKVKNIIDSRRTSDSDDGGNNDDDHNDKESHISADDTQSIQDDRAELKRLEDKMRRKAERHAKDLVSSHIGQSFLHPTDQNHDGYVPNQDLILNIGLDDDEELENLHEKSTNEDLGNINRVDEIKAEDDHDYTSDSSSDSDRASGSTTHKQNQNSNMRGDPDYVPPPKKVKEGVLGSLLKLYAGQDEDEDEMSTTASPSTSEVTSPSGSSVASPINSPMGSPLGSPSLGISGQPSDRPSPDGRTKRRPNYFRTYSSEAALGREGKSRPKWYKSSSSAHVPSLSKLASSGLNMATDAAHTAGSAAHLMAPQHTTRNPLKRSTASGRIPTVSELKSDFTNILGGKAPDSGKDKEYREAKEAKKKQKKEKQRRKEKEKALKKARLAEQARITVHIADLLQRQRFLLRLGRALMLFGAPTHRLEEYLKITARVLEIDAQVLYIPGCMLVSFGDATTHTSETKLLRVTQGLNLYKLHATHLIYKEVVHDIMGLEEASSHIDHLLESGNLYPWWLVVIFYGLSCASFGMFAYGGYWPDLPMMFLVSAAVGFLQFWVQPRSDLYANVFEVTSSIVVSFLGRAIGSIGKDDTSRVFCFAAIAQGSLSLILPGYIILVGALELQTKNLVAGSVRMFYANIYSLFLSFGITLGSAIYGWIDREASGETKCRRTVNDYWKILFVPSATVFIAMVNQASFRQLPVMVLVGAAGYAVLFFVQQQVKNASAFTSAIGAFTVGILGNLYSRVGHGLAFAAMLPGIFSLVPSSVAAQGSLVAGVAVADAIVNSDSNSSSDNASNAISDLGSTMTQVAVGIVVGLFAATLVVYPLGFKKKRSGLFTF